MIRVVCDRAVRPVTIKFRGALDNQRAEELRLAFRCVPDDRDVIVDLADVTGLDWAGLKAIIAGIRGVQDHARRGVICGGRGSVARMLQLAGAHRFVTVLSSREAAIEWLEALDLREPDVVVNRVGVDEVGAAPTSVVADAIRVLHGPQQVGIGLF